VVVDLWKNTDAFKPDDQTLTHIMDSGKTIASILVAIQVDQGLIKYEDTVSKHWPEFG